MAGCLTDSSRYAHRAVADTGGKISGSNNGPLPEVVCNILGHSYNHGIRNRIDYSTVVAVPDEDRQSFAKRMPSLIQTDPNFVAPSLTPKVVGSEQTNEESELYLIVGLGLWSRKYGSITAWERSRDQNNRNCAVGVRKTMKSVFNDPDMLAFRVVTPISQDLIRVADLQLFALVNARSGSAKTVRIDLPNVYFFREFRDRAESTDTRALQWRTHVWGALYRHHQGAHVLTRKRKRTEATQDEQAQVFYGQQAHIRNSASGQNVRLDKALREGTRSAFGVSPATYSNTLATNPSSTKSFDLKSTRLHETRADVQDPLITQDLGITYVEKGLTDVAEIWDLPSVKAEPETPPSVGSKIKIEDQENDNYLTSIDQTENLPPDNQSRGHRVQNQNADVHTMHADKYSQDASAQFSHTRNAMNEHDIAVSGAQDNIPEQKRFGAIRSIENFLAKREAAQRKCNQSGSLTINDLIAAEIEDLAHLRSLLNDVATPEMLQAMIERFEYALGNEQERAKSAFGHALLQISANIGTASKTRVEALRKLRSE